MTTYYMQAQSGDVATEREWHDDYNSMDVEGWFGKESDDITEEDKANWQAGDNLVEVDIDRMICDIPDAVFEDSYGSGVALAAGVSYSTYQALAEAYGLEISDYE